MAKEISFSPTGKRHDVGMNWQDFNILLDGKKKSCYDFSLINVGGIYIKVDMDITGRVRLRVPDGFAIEASPIDTGNPNPTVFRVVRK